MRVLVAPVIPGLKDSEIPATLAAAKKAGAAAAEQQMLHLPLTVATVLRDWLERERPNHLRRVESRTRSVRDGKLSGPTFGTRMTSKAAGMLTSGFIPQA